MSLLMQALKKAERAKQNHLQADELVKPSEELDLVLAPLEPAPRAAAGTVRGGAAAAPLGELSLSPLQDDAPLLDTPWIEARHYPQVGAGASAPADQLSAAEPAAATPPPRPDSPPRPASGARTAPPPKAAPPKAARGIALDPQTLRLLVLGGVALLIVALFALVYWRAVLAPGPGSNLPMVPMPAQQFDNGAGAGLTLVAPPPGATPVAAPSAAATGLSDSAMAPPTATAPSAAVAPNEAATPQMTRNAGIPAMTPNAGGNDAAAMAPPSSVQAPEAAMAPPAQQQQQQQLQQGQLAAAPRQAAPRAERASVPGGTSGAADSGIKVRRSDSVAQVHPTLQAAYQAFNNGDTAAARSQYASMLQREPNNRDALLGMAAVALRDQQQAQAASLYLRLLELDPNDADAVAGLVGLRHGDVQQSEARLKAILERSPEAGPVLFTLGNLYAQQGRWPEAQQTFFRAYSSTPANPDYAFNLAVGLDRLNQPRLALGYYQRALALASDSPAGFDKAAARRRLHDLGAATTRPAQP